MRGLEGPVGLEGFECPGGTITEMPAIWPSLNFKGSNLMTKNV